MKKSERMREEAFKALNTTRKAFKEIPDSELEREIKRAITVVRRQNRKRASATL